MLTNEKMVAYRVIIIDRVYLVTCRFMEAIGAIDFKTWLIEFYLTIDKPDGVYGSIENTVMVVNGNTTILAVKGEHAYIDEYDLREFGEEFGQ